MVRCCSNICLLPGNICDVLFKNRGKNQKFEIWRQCYYNIFSKQIWMKKRNYKRWWRSYSGLSKRLVVLRKLTIWTRISLLTVLLYLSERNKRMSITLGVFEYFSQKKGNARRNGLLFQFQSQKVNILAKRTFKT